MMEKKKLAGIAAVCLLFLGIAWYMQTSGHQVEEGNRIARGEPGEGTMDVNLTLKAEGVEEAHDYPLTVRERGITEEEAEAYFVQAEAEIDEDFFTEGESAGWVTQKVCMEDYYVQGLVKAEWSLDSYRYIGSDGMPNEEVPAEGTQITATADLVCGNYNVIYQFDFCLYPRDKTIEEHLIEAVNGTIEAQQEAEGETYLVLPDTADGRHLSWEEKKEPLVMKVLLFEVVILVLLHFVKLERARECARRRKEQMRLDYAEVVSKLLILLGSGMSLKQSWNRISAQYLDKRNKNRVEVRYVYEEMLVASHEMSDGVSERAAYQNFGERTALAVYQRLIRILVQNLQTGSRGLCQMLAQESEGALEERKALAKKLGEEAGTKLLFPMILMLGIVVAIIMVPAMLSFNI